MTKNRKRLYIELVGGLGNQLFQGVAAISLAKTDNYLALGISNGLQSTSSHGQSIFEMRLMGLNEVRLKIFQLLLMKIGFRIASLKSKKRFSFFGFTFYAPKEIGYSLSQIQGKYVFLRGYFQSHKYLEGLSVDQYPRLRNETKDFLSAKERIALEQPTVIHIRMGDFANSQNEHGIVSPEYYARCVAELREKEIISKAVWIFSDETEGLDEYIGAIGIPAEIVSRSNKLSAVEELMLMSESKCLIIGNSTFGLWAALIASNRHKSNVQILCPEVPYFGLETPLDFFPPGWTRVRTDFV
jgi:hypothetical protein